MKKQSIYLAGPITGQSYNGATDWREEFEVYFKPLGIHCYSPMRGKAYLNQEALIKDHYEGTLLSNLKAITTRDRDDVANAGVMICNFIGAEIVSIGTCIEIGWADGYRVPTIVILDEGNLHHHGMIKEMCLVVDTITDAKTLAAQILGVLE